MKSSNDFLCNDNDDPLSTQNICKSSEQLTTFSSYDHDEISERLQNSVTISRRTRSLRVGIPVGDEIDGGVQQQHYEAADNNAIECLSAVMRNIECASFCRDPVCKDVECTKGHDYLKHFQKHIEQAFKPPCAAELADCEQCCRIVQAIINHASGLCNKESDQIVSCTVPFCDTLNRDKYAALRSVDTIHHTICKLADIHHGDSLHPYHPTTMLIEDSRLGDFKMGMKLVTGEDYICYCKTMKGQFGQGGNILSVSFKEHEEIHAEIHLVKVSDEDGGGGKKNLAVYKKLVYDEDCTNLINRPLWAARGQVSTSQGVAATNSAHCSLPKFIAVKDIPGLTLREYVHNCLAMGGVIKDAEYMNTLHQILSAADYLHKKDIIFSLWTMDDIKVVKINNEPPHVLLDNFTLAYSSETSACDNGDESDDDDMSMVRMHKIPAQYLPPELLTNSDIIDVKCDVWSIGCLAYELVKGHCVYSAFNHSHPHCIRELIRYKCHAMDAVKNARTSAEIEFLVDLCRFWRTNGFTLQIPQTFADQDFDLYKLYCAVKETDSPETIRWRNISLSMKGSPQYSDICRYHYSNIIKPYHDSSATASTNITNENLTDPNTPLRPVIPPKEDKFGDLFPNFLKKCWKNNPSERPKCSQLLEDMLFIIYKK